MAENIEALAFEIARQQHGLISRIQLDELGVSRHLIRRHTASGAWTRLTRGLYRVGADAMTIEDRQFAALVAAPGGAALSHRSAAVKWGLDTPPAYMIQLTIAQGQGYTPMSGIEVFRSRDLRPEDVELLGELRVTTPARTIIDLAASLSDDELRAMIDSARRRDRAFDTALASSLRAIGRGHRGARRLREFLDAESGSTAASALESLAAGIIAEVNLGTPIRHLWEHDADFCAELDYAWPDELVDLELDGYAFHSTRAQLQSDKARDRTLSWMGWRVLRFTWDDCKNHRERVVRELRDNLLQRRALPQRLTSRVPRCPPP